LGPNKATIFGLLQPVLDGIKLLTKYLILPHTGQLFLISIRPTLMLGLFLWTWRLLLPWEGQALRLKYPSLVFFALIRAGAYSVIITGWSSTRSFSKLGRLRGILQRLSFEVVLIMSFLLIIGMLNRFWIKNSLNRVLDLAFFWMGVWTILSLIERNRAPFDLLEGERELISGFNIEMRRLTFVYLFLREYGIIIVIAAISSFLIISFRTLFIPAALTLLLIRSCYPRIRYDSLIETIWQRTLPLITVLFVIVILF